MPSHISKFEPLGWPCLSIFRQVYLSTTHDFQISLLQPIITYPGRWTTSINPSSYPRRYTHHHNKSTALISTLSIFFFILLFTTPSNQYPYHFSIANFSTTSFLLHLSIMLWYFSNLNTKVHDLDTSYLLLNWFIRNIVIKLFHVSFDPKTSL